MTQSIISFFHRKRNKAGEKSLLMSRRNKGLCSQYCCCFCQLFVCLFSCQFTPHLSFLFSSFKLRFVLAPGPTVASHALVPKGNSCTQIEVCPQAGAIIESMTEVIAKHGGCALIVDYGAEKSTRHTLRVSKLKLEQKWGQLHLTLVKLLRLDESTINGTSELAISCAVKHSLTLLRFKVNGDDGGLSSITYLHLCNKIAR